MRLATEMQNGARQARLRVSAWLADVGARCGLPADACRVHGWLYLTPGGASLSDLSVGLHMSTGSVEAQLAWLSEVGIVDQRDGTWRTGSDPWELVVRVLRARRDRELPIAREVLRQSEADASGTPEGIRIARMRALVEDIAAIESSTQRISPDSMRRALALGGRVARLFGAGGRR